MTSKVCRKCGEQKSLSSFPERKGATDGRRNECRECQKQYNAVYYQRHDEKIKAQAAAYYQRNWDACRERGAAYYQEHREEYLAKTAAYRAEHKEQYRETSAAYYRGHRDAIIAKVTAWVDENRERRREYVSRWRKTTKGREARVASEHNRRTRSGGKLSRATVGAVKRSSGGLCPYCNQPITDGHIDHIVPIARGGTNDRDNLVWACAPCNVSKGSKSLLEFMMYRRAIA